MSRVLYFDAFNGISGDMVLGALIDLGLPLEHLREELDRLGLEEVDLHTEIVERQGLFGVNLTVRLKKDRDDSQDHSAPHEHPHGHHHDHSHTDPHDDDHNGQEHAHSHHHEHVRGRGFREIREMIQESGLDSWIRETSVAIFRRLGEAEAKVHRSTLEEVHFHEVGAVDSIVDVVGTCIGFRYFEIERFLCSPIHLGGGTVTFSHGTWPVPTPATAELLKGFPTVFGPVERELTTPTGAAIVSTLARPAGPEVCVFEKWGLGAGDREFPHLPNMLRLMLGSLIPEADRTSIPGVSEEEVTVLEASIDDTDAESLGYFQELALKRGALDVTFSPLFMKKGRPGVLLSVLCRPDDQAELAELVFQETTTLGVRRLPLKRWVLDRELRRVETPYGPVTVKVARIGGRIVNQTPEYEDLRRAAERSGQPLKRVRQEVFRRMFQDSSDE